MRQVEVGVRLVEEHDGGRVYIALAPDSVLVRELIG